MHGRWATLTLVTVTGVSAGSSGTGAVTKECDVAAAFILSRDLGISAMSIT